VAREHRMHRLWNADDRIDGARTGTQIAADAERLVDPCDAVHARAAEARVERARVAAEHLRERADRRIAARRAAVDVRAAGDDRLGIRPTAGEAALRALD